jgi:response regulator of citrate/malate metabolism
MSTPQLLMIEDDTRLAQMVGEYLNAVRVSASTTPVTARAACTCWSRTRRTWWCST